LISPETRIQGLPVIRKKEKNMETTTLVRVVAGVLALVILGIIIWRRKRQSID